MKRPPRSLRSLSTGVGASALTPVPCMAPPEGAPAVHGRLCKAGRLRGRGAMLREFPRYALGAARREAA